jgi:hypothetical protein
MSSVSLPVVNITQIGEYVRHRSGHRDDWGRGERANNSLSNAGAVSEPFSWKEETLCGSPIICRHLFNPAGGGELHGPDLEFEDDDSKRTFRIDSKTFDCQPNKRLFLINNNKHEELRATDTHYFCLLAPWHSRKALVAALVPYEHVDKWPVVDRGGRGALSRELPMLAFLRRYAPPGFALASLADELLANGDIESHKGKRQVLEELLTMIPALPSVIRA